MSRNLHVRELNTDELAEAWRLGGLAFGRVGASPPEHHLRPVDGLIRYGAFDPAGRLVGKAVDMHEDQWWCGRRVAAADVAGVAVAAEARGRGVARALLTALLRRARDDGVAISALFPTVSAPYRACGWEVCGELREMQVPTIALRPRRRTDSLAVTAGTAADLPAVHELYSRLARQRCGMLARDSARFAAAEPPGLPPGIHGLTLVHDRDELVGYASIERGHGYDDASTVTVHDAAAAGPDAAAALVDVLASWHSVAPTLRLGETAVTALGAHLPVELLREHEREVWMHRPVDVVAAVRSRGWPAHVRGTVMFAVTDQLAPWNEGAWLLELDGGAGQLTRAPGADPDLRLTPGGFALLYTATAAVGQVLATGHLSVRGGAAIEPLSLLASGQPAWLPDYF